MFDPAAIADDPMTQLMELLFTAGPTSCGEIVGECAGEAVAGGCGEGDCSG